MADWISVPRPTWFHGGARDAWCWQPWPVDHPFDPEWLSYRLPANGKRGMYVRMGELLVHAITFAPVEDWKRRDDIPSPQSIPDWDVFNGMRG